MVNSSYVFSLAGIQIPSLKMNQRFFKFTFYMKSHSQGETGYSLQIFTVMGFEIREYFICNYFCFLVFPARMSFHEFGNLAIDIRGGKDSHDIKILGGR